jgi:hypothetical protein
MLLAAFLVLLASTTLIAAGVVYGEAVAVGGVRRAIADAPPAGQGMLVTSASAAADVPAVDAAVRAELHAAMAPTDGTVSLQLGSGPFARDGDPAAGGRLVRVAAIEGIAEHADLTAGTWPVAGAPVLEAVVSEGAAAELGLAVGDALKVTSRLGPASTVEARIVGTWRPDPDDPFWFDEPLLLEGTRTEGGFTTLGPLVVAADDLLDRAAVPQIDTTWRAFPAVERLSADGVSGLRASVETADERLRAALPPPPGITVSTDLPATLASVATSVTVSRAGVLVLTLEFAVLAGYAIVMVGGMLADRRRGEVALLRSRGATTGALVLLTLMEALLLTVPAVLIAPPLAVILVRLVGEVGPLAGTGAIGDPEVSAATVVAACLAGIGCLIALAAPAVLSASSPAGERAASARPTGRGLAGRLGIDIVLVVVAALALWQLRLYGAPLSRDARGTLGVDPLLIAAPALTLLAGAVVATRLLPRLAELASPAAGRSRGVVGALATWGLARRPGRSTRAALLLMLAAALGTFAAIYQATWARSQADQATQQAGADVRAVMSDYPDLAGWAVGPALRALPGVAAATPVGVRSLDSGRVILNGTLLATQAETLTAAVAPWDVGDEDGMAAIARRLADARPSAPGAVLPADTGGLAVSLAGLQSTGIDGAPVLEPSSRLEVVAVLANADGVHRVSLGSVPISGDPARVAGALATETDAGLVSPALPARLLALELIVSAGPQEVVSGSLAVTGVEATSVTDPGPGLALPVDPTGDGWRWIVAEPGVAARALERRASGHVEIASGAGSPRPILGSPNPPTTFRLAVTPGPHADLAAIAGDAFLAATGANIGDTVAATVSGLPVTLRIDGRVDAIPTRDGSEPAVIVDAAALADLEFLSIGRLAPAREWWLATTTGADASVLGAVVEPPFKATEAVGRDELARQLIADPVALGVIGALALGSMAALAMAAVGFLLSATVSAGERLGEFAVLRAMGLPARALGTWLLAESAVLLTFGLVTGTALGLLLAWLVLPFASLTQTGVPPVPPASLVVPWEAILPLYIVGGLVLLATTAIATRRVPGVGLGSVLRTRANP